MTDLRATTRPATTVQAPSTTPDRFTERGSARRRERRRSRLRALLVATPVLGLVWVLAFSPLLGVRTVEVAGTVRASPEAVRQAAGLATGEPLLRLDAADVRARVLAEVPAVSVVQVQRRWPSSVLVTVVERTPVAVTPVEGGFGLLDDGGALFATEPVAPAGLPVLTLTAPAEDSKGTARGTTAALAVLAALPETVAPLVSAVTVSGTSEVTLGLDAGRSVVWGSATDLDRKAAALQVLVGTPGTVLDVSAPGLVTTR